MNNGFTCGRAICDGGTGGGLRGGRTCHRGLRRINQRNCSPERDVIFRRYEFGVDTWILFLSSYISISKQTLSSYFLNRTCLTERIN